MYSSRSTSDFHAAEYPLSIYRRPERASTVIGLIHEENESNITALPDARRKPKRKTSFWNHSSNKNTSIIASTNNGDAVMQGSKPPKTFWSRFVKKVMSPSSFFKSNKGPEEKKRITSVMISPPSGFKHTFTMSGQPLRTASNGYSLGGQGGTVATVEQDHESDQENAD